jgi:hypothetical protein
MNVSEKGNEVWGLINETILFIKRTAVRRRFEDSLTTLYARLQSAPVNPAILKEVHAALMELRKQIRRAGYDLSMGRYTLIFDGFHNDEVFDRFNRMVLFIDHSGVFYWQTGDDNHVEQASQLKQRLQKKAEYDIAEQHYLWFLWTKTTLTLSGSATEREDDYLRLQNRAQADPFLFLSRLKGLC